MRSRKRASKEGPLPPHGLARPCLSLRHAGRAIPTHLTAVPTATGPGGQGHASICLSCLGVSTSFMCLVV
jgi:hypothetical protein